MVNPWTKEKIEALTTTERTRLYKNARSQGTSDGDATAKLIEDSGLSYSADACLSLDDPVAVKMSEIVNSDKGRSAAKKAVENGLPALAGVDPLIAEALGADYGKHNMTTHTAGAIVAEVMREMGYREVGRSSPLPKGCIAKTGQMWK